MTTGIFKCIYIYWLPMHRQLNRIECRLEILHIKFIEKVLVCSIDGLFEKGGGYLLESICADLNSEVSKYFLFVCFFVEALMLDFNFKMYWILLSRSYSGMHCQCE